MIQERPSSEEKFYDIVGEQILSEECLIIDEPGCFLAGSLDAFRYMLQQIGYLEGKKILDYGCGSGWFGVYLAKRGAEVEGFDISGKQIEVANRRAQVNGVSHACNFRKLKAEALEYPNDFFDIVVGISILHHIELSLAGCELQRVMKLGAVAVFIEPLGENPVLNLMRYKVFNIHHGLKKDKTIEHPLTYENIHSIGRNFSCYSWKEFQLLSMARRFIGDRIIEATRLPRIDDWLLMRLPSLRRFCRLVVIEFRK